LKPENKDLKIVATKRSWEHSILQAMFWSSETCVVEYCPETGKTIPRGNASPNKPPIIAMMSCVGLFASRSSGW